MIVAPQQGPEKRPKLDLPAPFIVTIGNLKGGAGKTTSVFFLAAYFRLVYELRVLIIDADPLSQSAYSWYRHVKKLLAQSGEAWPFDLVTFPSKHVDECIEDQIETGKYDVIIVDTGGESPEIFKAAVRKSHELLIACAPTELALERVEPSFVAAEEAARDVPQSIGVRVLLTTVPPPPSNEGRDARRELAAAGYDTFGAQATNWKWYRQAGKSTNPLDDLAEYEDIGDELVAGYVAGGAA